jgi:hypothetical protein
MYFDIAGTCNACSAAFTLFFEVNFLHEKTAKRYDKRNEGWFGSPT